MKVADNVEQVSCVELEGTALPIVVEDGVQPAIRLHIAHDLLVETIQVEVLRPAVDPS